MRALQVSIDVMHGEGTAHGNKQLDAPGAARARILPERVVGDHRAEAVPDEYDSRLPSTGNCPRSGCGRQHRSRGLCQRVDS